MEPLHVNHFQSETLALTFHVNVWVSDVQAVLNRVCIVNHDKPLDQLSTVHLAERNLIRCVRTLSKIKEDLSALQLTEEMDSTSGWLSRFLTKLAFQLQTLYREAALYELNEVKNDMLYTVDFIIPGFPIGCVHSILQAYVLSMVGDQPMQPLDLQDAYCFDWELPHTIQTGGVSSFTLDFHGTPPPVIPCDPRATVKRMYHRYVEQGPLYQDRQATPPAYLSMQRMVLMHGPILDIHCREWSPELIRVEKMSTSHDNAHILVEAAAKMAGLTENGFICYKYKYACLPEEVRAAAAASLTLAQLSSSSSSSSYSTPNSSVLDLDLEIPRLETPPIRTQPVPPMAPRRASRGSPISVIDVKRSRYV
jgi:hypothetical protein